MQSSTIQTWSHLGEVAQVEGVVALGRGGQELRADGVVDIHGALDQRLCHALDILIEVFPEQDRQCMFGGSGVDLQVWIYIIRSIKSEIIP